MASDQDSERRASKWAAEAEDHARNLSPDALNALTSTLIAHLSPSQLASMTTLLLSRIKRDFLAELPTELALHIVGFVREPKALLRAGRVSKAWRRLVMDEAVWRSLCQRRGFEPRPEQVSPPPSFLSHFKAQFLTEHNWRHGGRLLRSQRSPDTGVVTSLAMDDTWIVVGLANSRVHVFSASTGVLSRTLIGHDAGVWAVWLVSSGGEQLFPAPTPVAPSPTPNPNPEPFQSIFESLEGRIPSSNSDLTQLPSDPCNSSPGWGQPSSLVLSGGCDKSIRVWDAKSGYCLYVLTGHTSTIRCMKVLRGRPIAVSGGRDGTLRTWDILRGLRGKVMRGHGDSVRALDVREVEGWVVSGSYDCTVRLWDIHTGVCLHTFEGHFHQVYTVLFLDAERIASGGIDTTVRIWSTRTGACLGILQGHTSLVCQLQLSVGERLNTLVTGGSDGRILIFSIPPHESAPTVPSPSACSFAPLLSPPLSPALSDALSAEPEPEQDAGCEYKLLTRLAAHTSSVTGLQLSPRWLVSGGNDGRLQLWEFADETDGARKGMLRPVRELTTPSEVVWKVAFRGQTCVVACRRESKTVLEIWSFRP